MHTLAAYFPDKPEDRDQVSARSFIKGLANLYACNYCAKDFQQEIENSPPAIESREAFSIWCCEQHNIVNKKLGKEHFECDIAKLDERWRTGCQSGKDEDADITAAESLGQE